MKDTTIQVQRFVEKSEEGLYLTVPFEVPESTESFSISYEYDRKKAIIDIGLNDSSASFMGWAGSDRAVLQISEVNSSPGFETGAVKPGTWQILLGAYHVPDEGVMVTYTVAFTAQKMRLLRGDIHMHSVASDGALTSEQLKAAARSQKLDFIAITDHNNFAYLRRNFSEDDLTVIPGVEWTHYKGHINLLGSMHPFTSFVANSKEEMLAVLQEAKKNGAVLSLNHPFCPNCGWKFGFDIPFDMVEIWNGGLSPKANLACVSWWDRLLQEGRKVPIVGGSDFHRFQFGHIPAFPCTFAYAKSRSAADILDALKSGRGFAAISPEGPILSLQAAGRPVYTGDTLAPGTQVEAKIAGTKAGDSIRLVTSGSSTLHPAAPRSTQIQFEMPESGYLRLEVIRQIDALGLSIPVMIANPLYAGGSL
jgi:hypothetical protein